MNIIFRYSIGLVLVSLHFGIYVFSERILKKDEITDLGVIFDHGLTFKSHINSMISRIYCMYGMGYRFAKDLRSPSTIMNIVAEYYSIIWSQNRKEFFTWEQGWHSVPHIDMIIMNMLPSRSEWRHLIC